MSKPCAHKARELVALTPESGIYAMIEKRELLELEKKVWDALVSGDSGADSLLSDDFFGVYTSGFERKEDYCNPIESGPTMHKYSLSDVTMKILSPDVALISYRAEFSRYPVRESNSDEVMYVSSIWKNQNGRWLNVFSQDTVGS